MAPADDPGPAFLPISLVDDGGSGMATASSPSTTTPRRGLIDINLGDDRWVRGRSRRQCVRASAGARRVVRPMILAPPHARILVAC